MSGYPIVLRGEAITALVVGGGAVAERKARALLASGARVTIVARAPGAGVESLGGARCTVIRRDYRVGDADGATLVIAATDRPDVNARVADDARSRGLLVNVADQPDAGTFVTPATHRTGELVIAVTAGGVPTVAARVRDAIAARFDARYGAAAGMLAAVRRRLLGAGDRAAWRRAAATLVTDDFCAAVESGRFAEEVAAWR